MTTQYNLQNIRALLTEGFTDEELRCLCYDVPGFKSVYDQLVQHTSKVQVISQLIKHADRKLQFEALLTWAKTHNSARYEKHQPYQVLSEKIVSADRPEDFQRTEYLDSQILQILYAYYQQNLGEPETSLNELTMSIKAERAEVVTCLLGLKQKKWVDFSLTAQANSGLVWLTVDGIKVARGI